MSWFRGLAFILTGLTLHGCATMNEAECVTGNWYAVGLEDGSRGEQMDRLGRHREACAKFGISPNVDRYRQGREEGLNNYCRESAGFYHGKSGHTYRGVCPPHLEHEFLVGYEAGQNLFGIHQQINHYSDAIDRKR